MSDDAPRIVDPDRVDDALRLPQEPGVFRGFWAAHPVLLDTLLVLLCVVVTWVSITLDQDAFVRLVEAFRTFPDQWLTVVKVIASFAACGALLWRRRHPVWVFAVVAAPVVLPFAFTESPATVTIMIAAYGLAVYGSTRIALVGVGVFIAALMVGTVVSVLTATVPLPPQVPFFVLSTAMVLIGMLMGMTVGGRRRYHEALVERSRQLVIERDQRGRLAASAERARIAREMHDVVSHSLTVVVALSDGIGATKDLAAAQRAGEAIAATSRTALTEMRSMLGVLREGSDDDAPLAPTQAIVVDDLVQQAQDAGFPVRLQTSGAPPQAERLRYAIGRIVQESLTNAFRHAPSATSIVVAIDATPDAVTVRVVNDGATDVAGEGYGIRGMQERAAQLGGTVRAGREAGTWVVDAGLPGDQLLAQAGRADADPVQSAPAPAPRATPETKDEQQ